MSKKRGGATEVRGADKAGAAEMQGLEYDGLKMNENALKVLERRYLRKDKTGKVTETPTELFKRVSENIALPEKKYRGEKHLKETRDEFYRIMTNLEFLPNSPTLMNAGRELQQLSACFVLPIDDSMTSIFETLKQTALIHKSGGGTGFSFSRLRPAEDMVLSTRGIASGPISFMQVYDIATETIKQGGTRRGANMGILRVDHPNIKEFIDAKLDNKKLNNFNISVAITDKFMEALENGEDFNIMNPRSREVNARFSAREIFDMIVKNAWKNGEPGIIFIDRINRYNPTPHVGTIESTNPCGEQPLLPYESCNLGSINLSQMAYQTDEGEWAIDYPRLRRVARSAVRFLDNVIDMNKFPLKEIKTMTLGNRKIGLGVMGFADLLYKLGIPYNSNEALEVAEELMKFINDESKMMSIELAEERGEFPNYHGSIFDHKGGPRLRNATTTTIAPTGTISIIAGCSSGIEPVFAIVFKRTVMDKDELIEVNPVFEEYARARGFYTDELMRDIAEKGSLKGIEGIPEDVVRVFVTAHDISPEWHIKMQAAFQKFTDNAVSKTVNFPHDAAIQDVETVYMLAFKLGCKGVTIYRDGSREEQVLSFGSAKGGAATSEYVMPGTIKPRPRPEAVSGTTVRMNTGCGKLYVTINTDEYGIFEVFSQMGKSGGCANSQSEAVSRLVSLALRAGVDPHAVIKHIKGIRCPSPSQTLMKGGPVLSCPDAIAKAIERHLRGEQPKPMAPKKETTLDIFDEDDGDSKAAIGNVAGVCPDCGTPLAYEEGCLLCRMCGYSKCG